MNNYRLNLLVLIVGWGLLSRGQQTKETTQQAEEKMDQVARKHPVSIANGKFFDKDGRKFLWGGEDDTWHLDLTDYFLRDEQFHYGIGREKFHALIEPQFISAAEADLVTPDSTRFLVLAVDDDVRAYSIELLTHHEVVNDVVGGKPVMAAYCILTDLGQSTIG